MRNVDLNNIGYNQYSPKIANSSVKSPSNFVAQTYPYPIYAQVPYGINKTDYIKLGVQKLPSGDMLHTYILTTGQKVGIIKNDTNSPLIYNRVNVGSYDEPKGKEGMSHLIEHSMYHSSKNYPDGIDKFVESIGGYTNAHTNTYETCYYIQLNNNENLEKALDINSDMIYNPDFSKLDKEKPIVISEMHERESDESSNIYNLTLNKLSSKSKQRITNLNLGSEQTINSITRDDMIDYHKKHYVPSNITTVVISNREPDELIKTVAQKFKQSSNDKIYPPENKKTLNIVNGIERSDIISKDSLEKSMIIDTCVPELSKQDKYNLIALCELIKKHTAIGYDLSKLYDKTGRLSFCYNDLEFSEYEVFELLKKELNNIVQNPPDDFELECIKNKIISSLDENYQDSNSQAEIICEELSKNKSDFNDRQIINNLNTASICSAAQFIDTSRCSIGVSHPYTTTKEDLDKNFKQYQNYTNAVTISKQKQNVDITNSLVKYNISPYTKENVYNTNLPDNTNLTMINSNNNKCTLRWELFNTNTNTYNPAIKLILDSMSDSISIQDIYKSNKMAINASVNFLNYNGLAANLKCSKDNLADGIELLKKSLDRNFNEKNFKKAKEEALQTIKTFKETADDKRTREKLGISYLGNPDELEKELNKVTLNDVRKYYNEIICNSYSIANIIAPFDNNPELFNKVASSLNVPNIKFKQLDSDANLKIYSKNEKSNVYISNQENNQPEFEVVYNYLSSSNPVDETKFELLANVLRSRIYDDIREKQGLVYTPQAYQITDGNCGSIGIKATSNCQSAEDTKKIFKAFDSNIEKLKNEPISEQELQKAKDELKQKILDIFNDSENAQFIINNAMKYPSGLFMFNDSFKIIDEINLEDIQKAAQYVFSDKPDYLIDASKKFNETNMEFYKTLGNIKN